MRTVAEVTVLAGRKWRTSWPDWLADDSTPPPAWPLHPPTEREVAAAPDDVAAAVSAWAVVARRPGVTVEWVERRTRAFGMQRYPVRVTLAPAAVADLVGESDTWATATQAARLLHRAWPDRDLTGALRTGARRLAALSDEEAARMVAVLGWLAAYPDSGLWEREVPVPGIDTKWVERHRTLIEALHECIAGGASGLRRTGVSFRVRQLGSAPASGPRDFTVDLPGLAALTLRPRRVLIVENLTSLLVLPDLPDTVALHGMGFAAPSLAVVGWIRDAPDLLYWGDLDTYGMLILGQVRAALAHTRSILMDVVTLRSHRALVGAEPRPFRGEIGHLTAEEHRTLSVLRAGDLRLEQERIPREAAHRALRAALLP